MLAGIFPALLGVGLLLVGAPGEVAIPLYLIPGIAALAGGLLLMRGGPGGYVVATLAWVALASIAGLEMLRALRPRPGLYAGHHPPVDYWMIALMALYILGAVAVIATLLRRLRPG